MLCGGIDLGGTKIEARLFDGPGAETRDVRRVPTPTTAFAPMLEALVGQVEWLTEKARAPIPIGLSLAGLIDPETGESFASNIPATGHALGPSVQARSGYTLTVVNDCMAFAYSEAHGGAGEGVRSVMGLILGTGVGGGICIDGALPRRHAGLAVEIGHVGMSARALERHGLPLWRCGCGRRGCLELYVSGTGMTNICQWLSGHRRSARELAEGDDEVAATVVDIWADLAAECLDTVQIMLDPDCVVLGGGLSNMGGIETLLTDRLRRARLGTARPPAIVRARHGDSSGARGAALIARAGWSQG